MLARFTILIHRVIGIVAVLGCASALAAPDVRIVVDVSQRVHTLDGAGLRSQFVSEFVQFLPDDALASIWTYAGTTERMVNHSPTDAMWRQVAEIHGRQLVPRGRRSDPESALNFAMWDLRHAARGPIDVIWIGDGRIELQNGKDPDASQDRLIRQLAPQLSDSRVRIHTLALSDAGGLVAQAGLSDASAQGVALMRQLTQVSGGLHRAVSTAAQVSRFAADVLRLVRAHDEAMVDERGRFQIAPGTERFTVMWRKGEGEPGLRSPGGGFLSDDKPLSNGRWLKAKVHEMVTVERPEPGWWEAQGRAVKVGVWSELRLTLEGLDSPVVPGEETSAILKLFSNGERVKARKFLDLLDVRAWLIQGEDKQPLPVERADSAFEILFVDLDDGAYELEVGVVAPSFAQSTTVPFVVRNALRVDVREGAQGVSAWLSFNHSEIDYRTVRASVSLRKPPELGVVVPARKMSGGVWQVPIDDTEGMLELAFSVGGNYLNGEGFYLKTKPVTLSFPRAAGDVETFRFDALGKAVEAPGRVQGAPGPVAQFVAMTAEEPGGQPTDQSEEVAHADAERSGEGASTRLPLWFVGMISTVNLLVLLVIWWFLRPAALQLPEDADGAWLEASNSEKEDESIIKAFKELPA